MLQVVWYAQNHLPLAGLTWSHAGFGSLAIHALLPCEEHEISPRGTVAR